MNFTTTGNKTAAYAAYGFLWYLLASSIYEMLCNMGVWPDSVKI